MVNEISSTAVYTVLPLIVKDTFVSGLIGGFKEGLPLLLKPVSGWLADKTGMLKPFILFGYMWSAFTRFLIPLVKGAEAFLFGLSEMGKAVRDTPRDMVLASYKDRRWAFAIHRAMDYAGSVIGGLLVALLLWWIEDPVAVLWAGVFIGLLVIVPLMLITDIKVKSHNSQFSGWLKKELSTVLLVLVTGTALLPVTLYIDHIREYSILAGVGMLLFNVFIVLTSVFVTSKTGDVTDIGTGLVVSGIGHIMTVNNVAGGLAGFAVYGVGWGLVFPSVFSYIAEKSEDGAEMGFAQMVFGLGLITSSMLWGYVMSVYGVAGFLIGSTISVLLGIAVLGVNRWQK